MQTSASDLLLLVDHCLGGRVARRVRISGNRIRTIQEEWPGRDLRIDAPPDEEIIRHLGEKAGRLALWITQDWGALRKHGRVLDVSPISVLWLRWPKYSNFSAVERSRKIQAVIETAYRLVLESETPMYLRVRLDPDHDGQPLLERLRHGVLDRQLEWQRVELD